MEILRAAAAGTREKSDIVIHLEPAAEGICLNIRSVVMLQFGNAIRKTVLDFLAEQHVTHVLVDAEDFGAPDFVIRARLEAALARAGKEMAQ